MGWWNMGKVINKTDNELILKRRKRKKIKKNIFTIYIDDITICYSLFKASIF